MIPYMVGKLAPNSTHSTRGLVKYVPARGYFRAVPSQNGDKFVISPPPQSLNGSSGLPIHYLWFSKGESLGTVAKSKKLKTKQSCLNIMDNTALIIASRTVDRLRNPFFDLLVSCWFRPALSFAHCCMLFFCGSVYISDGTLQRFFCPHSRRHTVRYVGDPKR